MKPSNQPSTFLSTLCVVLLLLLWAYIRLILFPTIIAPLTFVLPLMLCIWTRRVWQLLTMVVAFVVIAFVKYYHVLPENVIEVQERSVLMGVTLVNIFVGAAIIYATLRLRLKLEQQNNLLTLQNETLSEQQSELEAQSEELAQQNEELKSQSEELTQQNEQIEAQSEELQRQNEELKETSDRLERREELLAGLLTAARASDERQGALDGVCRHTLASLGAPAEAVAILVLRDGSLEIAAQCSDSGAPISPVVWPRQGSIAGVVCEQKKTAYISDLREEPDLSAPFGSDGPVRSVIAAPITFAGSVRGILAAVSSHVSDWTQDQFQLLEWTAAQCALVLESNRLQGAMQERTREIEKASRAKDDFLAMLSHELRTPLTPVLATASELENDSRLPADVRDDLAMIRRNVDIQSRLVDDLLDLTKIARGKLDVNPKLIDLRLLLKEAVAIVRPEAQEKHQTILCEEPVDGGFWVKGDPARLHQVFWNLLKNAVRYSPEGATIRVSRPTLIAESQLLSVSISDHGVGISAADLERIFRPFEQVASVGKHRHGDGGLGLGLAIANAIIEIHGGTIRAESSGIGKGSTFTVLLPAAEAPRTLPTNDRLHCAKPVGAPLRILLVEDHGDTARVVSKLLRISGYHVEHARTAAEARRLFQGAWFDLLISDLGLPDESGIELMRQLRALRPNLLGICVSGYGMEHDLSACREAGFSEHLTKPIEMERLRLAISRTGASRREDEPLLEQRT
ncbi:MAG: ATP-binding protein [Nibricoccus sp.]